MRPTVLRSAKGAHLPLDGAGAGVVVVVVGHAAAGGGAVTVAGNIGGNNDKSGTRHRTNRHQSSNANVKQQSLAKINMSSVAGAGGGTNPVNLVYLTTSCPTPGGCTTLE